MFSSAKAHISSAFTPQTNMRTRKLYPICTADGRIPPADAEVIVCVAARPPSRRRTMSSSFVFWICLFVGCTTLPMTIDLLRVFLPRRLRTGRLVEAWQRPVLLAMVVCLCVWAYAAFFPIAAYSHPPGSAAWLGWLGIITLLWINSVYNYAACAILDPGYAHEGAVAADGVAAWPEHVGGGASAASTQMPPPAATDNNSACTLAPARTDGTSLCKICMRRVHTFDHHCPLYAQPKNLEDSIPIFLAVPLTRQPSSRACADSTGGCVGRDNYGFFFLFVTHCGAGCGLACVLAWRPFLECVVRQCTVPLLGLSRTPPPSEASCVALGSKSLLFLPALCLHLALLGLGGFHALLLANGLTTLQCVRARRHSSHTHRPAPTPQHAAESRHSLGRYARRWKARGLRSLQDLVTLHGEAETDKWALLWGCPPAGTTGGRGGLRPSLPRKLRVALLPSMPRRRRASPGVAQRSSWLGAAVVLAALFALLPFAASFVEAAGAAAHATLAQGTAGLAKSLAHPAGGVGPFGGGIGEQGRRGAHPRDRERVGRRREGDGARAPSAGASAQR